MEQIRHCALADRAYVNASFKGAGKSLSHLANIGPKGHIGRPAPSEVFAAASRPHGDATQSNPHSKVKQHHSCTMMHLRQLTHRQGTQLRQGSHHSCQLQGLQTWMLRQQAQPMAVRIGPSQLRQDSLLLRDIHHLHPQHLRLQDEHTAEYTLGQYPQQLCLYKQNPTGGASNLLASAIASPKTWAGTWSIKAMAIALHRNVVINPEKCELYTRDDAVDSRGSQSWPSVFYPRGKHTRKGNNRVDLPKPPTLEQMLAAGMVMEAPFSTV
ncbi:TPA: hypothetical protein ACH3X1_003690 [Trebouxia sp. C0004]